MYEYNLALRFQRVAEQQARRIALWFSDRDRTTYAELNARANRIAHWLLDHGVARGDVVCLSGTKTVSTFAAIMACLKIGAPYTILDPDNPVERLARILTTCRPRALLAEANLLATLRRKVADTPAWCADLAADSSARAIRACPDTDVSQSRDVTGSDIAYIMYTSGSTGVPKGAVITHDNVLNLVAWSQATFAVDPEDVVTNLNPLFFDNSVFDVYVALLNGACLVPFSKAQVTSPQILVERIEAAACSLWFSVPSLLMFLQTMKAADGRHLRTIRRFVFGGEGYPKAKLKPLYERYSDASAFFNVYGPTECTCICSSYRVTDRDWIDTHGVLPLGQIASNFDWLLVDADGGEVAAGEWGELCLLGPNVGRGYYNDPARTAEAFVQNPRQSAFREPMYKTGDIVRQDPVDGRLYIRGRRDNQIKHMGYRIELEEIESALNSLENVREAAALQDKADGLSRIVAVVVCDGGVLHDEQLRADLRRIIPDYMIPSVFVRDDRLPRNGNGKIDRRALAERYAPSGV